MTTRSRLCRASLLALCLFVLAAPRVSAAMPVTVKQRIEVGFVLDTTGSMADLIDGAKKKIWSIANAIVDKNPDAEIRMGLVGYRDIGDEYVTRHFPLTTDIQNIYAELLRFTANGGGDMPESVNEALDVAVTRLGWTDSGQSGGAVSRILFLVGDAPPHMDYAQDRKYPEVIREAVSKGIIVNTVQAGNMASTRKFWKEMANLGGGDYHAIPQDGGRVIIIETPFDERIRIIQIDLNKTIVPYGDMSQQRDVESKTRLYEKAAPAASADMSSYVNKSAKGKAIITGGGDLVADIAEGKKALKDVPEKELPAAMQTMKPGERQAYLDKQNGERLRLSAELKELVLKRDAFLQEKEKQAAPAAGDNFDRSVSKTLEKQIR